MHGAWLKPVVTVPVTGGIDGEPDPPSVSPANAATRTTRGRLTAASRQAGARSPPQVRVVHGVSIGSGLNRMNRGALKSRNAVWPGRDGSLLSDPEDLVARPEHPAQHNDDYEHRGDLVQIRRRRWRALREHTETQPSTPTPSRVGATPRVRAEPARCDRGRALSVPRSSQRGE